MKNIIAVTFTVPDLLCVGWDIKPYSLTYSVDHFTANSKNVFEKLFILLHIHCSVVMGGALGCYMASSYSD